MFPIGESLAIRNLERAGSAGRERPAGDGGPHVAARRSPIADQNTLRRSPVAGRGAGARGLRGQGTARRDGGPHVAVRRSPIADQNAFQSGVRPSRVGTLEPAVSAGNGFLRAGNDPPGTAVSRQKHGGRL